MLTDCKVWTASRWAAAMLVLMVFAGCATTKNQAPVEDRTVGGRTPVSVGNPSPAPGSALPASVDVTKPTPGTENAGKAGYYSVKANDTLIRIGLETGQNWKDIVKWNNLENPNIIEVGQVLRVVPPGSDAGAASTRPVTATKADARPLDAKPAPVAASGVAAAPPTASGAAVPSVPIVVPSPIAATREGDDDVNWLWPSAGAVVAAFEEGKSKGLAIAGKAGDPVVAAADGRVVYAGSGLRGYGNLVILKHNNTYLTAYAHNQTLLVKEDQSVRRGQKIAEMGSTDAERVQLHFEIRKQGKPIDPARLLPPR